MLPAAFSPGGVFPTLLLTVYLLTGGCAHGAEDFSRHGISFRLPSAYFDSARLVATKKKVAVKDGFPSGVGPRGWTVQFAHPPRTSMAPQPGRYYAPAYSVMYIAPLADKSVPDFDAAYPGLSANASAFTQLMSNPARDWHAWLNWKDDAPRSLPHDLPDQPWNNAGQALRAHFRTVTSSGLSGFRLLTYYVQGHTGYGATNAELMYNFQGITRDGRWYVSARLAVRHPKLPDSIDDPRAKNNDTIAEQYTEQRRVNAWPDDTFYPPLGALDEMLGSVRVAP